MTGGEGRTRDEGNPDDGFGALWNLVVQELRARTLADQPGAARAFLDANPEIEAGPSIARQLSIVAPGTKALEAGLACCQAILRLANARRAAQAAVKSPGAIPGVEAIILDVLRIYLSAYIDAVRKFCGAAIGQLVNDDDDTRPRRDALKRFAAEAKKVLSTGRETVAHADTAYIRGITEEGLWAPMLLFDLAQEDFLFEMVRQDIETDRTKFEWRCNQLLKTAVHALAAGEAQMKATSELIGRKLRSVPGH